MMNAAPRVNPSQPGIGSKPERAADDPRSCSAVSERAKAELRVSSATSRWMTASRPSLLIEPAIVTTSAARIAWRRCRARRRHARRDGADQPDDEQHLRLRPACSRPPMKTPMALPTPAARPSSAMPPRPRPSSRARKARKSVRKPTSARSAAALRRAAGSSPRIRCTRPPGCSATPPPGRPTAPASRRRRCRRCGGSPRRGTARRGRRPRRPAASRGSRRPWRCRSRSGRR